MGAVLVRGATGSGGANAAGAGLALLAQIALARLLGVSEYGHYVYAFTWAMLLALVCRLGFHNSLVRYTAAYRVQADWSGLRGLARRSGQLVVGAGALAGIALACVAWALADRMPPTQFHAFLLAAVMVVPMSALGVTEGLLRGYRRTARALLPFRAFIQGGTLILAMGAAATVVLNAALIPAYGIEGAAFATAASMVFWNLWLLAETRRRHRLNPSVFGRWPRLRAPSAE